MAKRLKFVVEIDQPEGATVANVRWYIDDAVGSWCDQLGPDDPLRDVVRTAKVTRLTETKLRRLAGITRALDDWERRGEIAVKLAGLD